VYGPRYDELEDGSGFEEALAEEALAEEALAERDKSPRYRRALLLALLLCCLLLLGMGMDGAAREAGTSLRGAVGTTLQSYRRDFVNWRLGPVRVGLQIGHLRASEQPDELAALRLNTGAYAGGVSEVGVNLAVAERLKAKLEARGLAVDLLPATVPPGYRADLFVALHADSAYDPARRGYKSAHFVPARNPLEPVLKGFIDAAYHGRLGFPDDHHNVTRNMLHYYALNHRRYRHSVSPRTPGVIVELGYLSHPGERQVLLAATRPAEALAVGILGYLESQGRLRSD
jgi:hypothetical protein